MKKIIFMLALSLFTGNTQATGTDNCLPANQYASQLTEGVLTKYVKKKPCIININNADSNSYKSKGATVTSNEIGGSHTYIGRNQSVVKANNYETVKSSSSMSRSVILSSSTNDTINIENLESTAGELVQKVEDDRINKSVEQQNDIQNNINKFVDIFNRIAKDVIRENLGSEQDPKIQNAFKCKNPEDCKSNLNKNDGHKIAECEIYERLNWDGNSWQCYGLFESLPGNLECDTDNGDASRQYSYNIKQSDGTILKVCENFVFSWLDESYGECTKYNIKYANVICKRHKENQKVQNGKTVADDICYGRKPEMTKACTYEGTDTIEDPNEKHDENYIPGQEDIIIEGEGDNNDGLTSDEIENGVDDETITEGWGWGNWDGGECTATDAAFGECDPDKVVACSEDEVTYGYCDVATNCTDAAAENGLCTQKCTNEDADGNCTEYCTEEKAKKGDCDPFAVEEEEEEDDDPWWKF